jgi:ferric-dicitrate binding protein FerR (iron transport regulator)
MSLANAIPELNRWYDADVRLADPSLASQPVEGNVSAGSLSDLANILELSLDIRVVRAGRVLTLYPRF